MSEPPIQTAGAYHYDSSPEGINDTRRSAEVIVPLVLRLIRAQSVVDFGCGLGDWLRVFSERGCSEVVGLDGPWVPADHLQIPKDAFRVMQLAESSPSLGRRFDLACSLEVAEHVPPDAGERLVKALTEAADVVLFSAAIPHQGGYMHVNEQYQSHWIDQFGKLGYAAHDLIRPQIWMDERCCWWYQQNILLFATPAAAERNGLATRPFIADMVHPVMNERANDPRNWSGRMMLKMLGAKLMKKLGL
ncbi:MAG: methyltransferase domain-containing protein [Verrucomicrobiota bacterium]